MDILVKDIGSDDEIASEKVMKLSDKLILMNICMKIKIIICKEDFWRLMMHLIAIWVLKLIVNQLGKK